MPSPPTPAELGQGRRYKQLLFVNDYPPSGAAGAPIIARELFAEYDPARLDVLYCGSWANSAPDTFLPCRHTAVRAYTTRLRPRRVFVPIEASLNCLRLNHIVNVGRRIIRERGVEALFSTSYGAEMPHAAYFLAREFGLPFYYFEMDRLDAVYLSPLTRRLINRHRVDFLKSAEKLWLISPKMIRTYEELYGVKGELLHHFVDLTKYEGLPRRSEQERDKISILYTGSFNHIVLGSTIWLARRLHRGFSIGGKPVELVIYGNQFPEEVRGPNVRYGGFVDKSRIPALLADADILFAPSTFDPPPGLREQVETSMATKTVDYLASGRPVLIIGPTFSGLVDYFGPYSTVVDGPDEAKLERALERIVTDHAYVAELRERGIELVRTHHSKAALHSSFLANFQVPAP